MIFTFGPFELDDLAGEVRCAGASVAMQPRVREVLCYLMEHRDRVVSRQELIAIFWRGQRVNRSAVPWTIGHARRALAQHAPSERLIETVRQRGYRFVGDVRERQNEAESERASDGEPPFVGRDAIDEELRAALDAAGAGRGEMLLISGDAGMGRSRVAAELAAHATARGVKRWGAGALENARPFGHLGQVLRDARDDVSLSTAESDAADDLLSAICSADPGTDRAAFWLCDRIAGFLASAARAAARVIVLDDLHRADEATLRTLDLLMPQLRRSRLLLIGTARDAVFEPHEHAASALASRYRDAVEVRLTSLPLADVARYLRAVLGATISDALVSAVYARTAGNPRFLAEAAGFLRSRKERGLPLHPTDVAIPQAARELVFARLGTLTPATRLVLKAGAALRGELDVATLTPATELSVHEVLSGVGEAIAARLMIAVPDTPRYAFASPLVRDVLAEAKLSPGTRRCEHPSK